MPGTARVDLDPSGLSLHVEPGAGLQDLLFSHGVEFPCGGGGRCRGCRVRVLEGTLPASPQDRALLGAAELDAGWRLACQARVTGNLRLHLAQWETRILGDHRPFPFEPQEGIGAAVDLGTTTLVAQLVDLTTGQVLATRSALNEQARYGGDIMSRIGFAMRDGSGALTSIVRAQVGGLIREMLPAAGPRLRQVVLAGNTAMHHLFCGIGVEPLAHHPFQPLEEGLQTFTGDELGWEFPAAPQVRCLPCLAGFVGGDLLAGLLATGIHQRPGLELLIDLGTNGELLLGNRERILCTSTAAGPAFEGARISMGMRASTGAISEARIHEGELRCRVIGGEEPRGLCGSGLVDVVAAGLDLGWILPSGRLTRTVMPVAGTVSLHQCDVRELQLAKGAVAAGIRILARHWGAPVDAIERVHLAGAFGNYINPESARRIGLLGFPGGRVTPCGNSSLRGAKIALCGLGQDPGTHQPVRDLVEGISLNEDPHFQDAYVDEMAFPARV
ncbi:MAG TPA: hypothetical protein DCM86_02505 [Verrucomicrobiales bacterium]|nr:hypothetical protein [Verrucomicrobiales bacterium]